MHRGIVKKIIWPLHEAVLSRPTRPILQSMEKSQWWPRQRLRALQRRKLDDLLEYARRRIPFYEKLPTAADLESLPIISKSDIHENREQLIDRSLRRHLRASTTGGSTGEPLAFLTDRNREAADQAARARSRRWFGVDVGDRELYLWGSPVELRATDRFRAMRDRLTNHRLLDAFQMSPARMTQYIRKINRFDPVHLFGYPSSLTRLFAHARDTSARIHCPSLKAVFVTGELLLPGDRAAIEESVIVPVADGYGCREAGFIAHQCPSGRYHVTMESLILELLDEQGRTVADGESGEVVVTHLDARGMPFIRYRTGDQARRTPETCPCGRGLEVLEKIEGRRTDLLRRGDGGVAHGLSVIYVLRAEPAVAAFRVVQRPNLDIDVEIVPRGSFDTECEDRIVRRITHQLGGGFAVRITRVESIRQAESGKYRYVQSEAMAGASHR